MLWGLIGVWIGRKLISALYDQVNNYSACWDGKVTLGAIGSQVFGENAWHDTCCMIKLHQCFCDISAHIISLNAAGYGVFSGRFLCWKIGQTLLLWYRLSRSMNEGIRSNVSPTWQRQRRVQLIRSHFNFISVHINSSHMAVTLGEVGGGSPTCPTTFGVRGRVKRERENKEDICPLGCFDTIFDTFSP